jgi:hypothetical protein
MTETLKKVADTLLERSVTLEVDISPQSRVQRLLQRWGLIPKKKTYVIAPINLGSMIKISKSILCLDVSSFQAESMLNTHVKIVEGHGREVAKIIAYAVVNQKKDPPESLIDEILWNFSSLDLLRTLSIVLRQMDNTSFMSSIISMKGLNLLAMSPQDQGSHIASGKSSEVQ